MERSEFVTMVAEILEVEPETVSFDDTLEELDWDSLSNISFIAEIDQRLGLPVDADELAKATTVEDLRQIVQGAAKAS